MKLYFQTDSGLNSGECGVKINGEFAGFAGFAPSFTEAEEDCLVELLPGRGENYCPVSFRLSDEVLKAGKIVEFRPEESRKLLKSILELKHGGRSVRSIIMQLAGGDDKKVLRYQNKYRNMIKNEKETVLGVVNEITALRGSCYNPYEDKDKKEIFASDFLFKRLQSEINSLYDRCTVSLKRENEKLKERLQAAEKENLQLKLSLERSISLNTTAYKIKEFFNKKDSKELIN